MKQQLTKYSMFLCLLLLSNKAIEAQAVNKFSVTQAVDYAKKNSVQVKNALIDYKIQQQTNREITAAAYPQISATGTFQDYLTIPTTLLPAEIAGGPAGTFVPVRFGTKYSATGGFDVQQLLFDGQVFVGLIARGVALDYYAKQQEVTEEMINVNVQKIYYQLVVGKQQMTSIDANIERFEKLLKDTKEIYKQGFAEKLDVDKVSVQLNNLQTEKVKVQSQLDAGNAGLKFLMNMPQKDTLILTDTLSEDMLKDNLLALDYKYENRKEFQLLTLGKKLGEYNVRRYKLSYLPTLAAFASYNKNAQRQKFDFFGDGPWFTTSLIGLRLNVPIFDGFAKSSRVQKAKLQLQQTNNQIEQFKNSVDNDVTQARLKITAAVLTLDAQKKNMILAEKVYGTTKLKYEQGLGTNQEIYNAQAELKVAQNNYYGALYDAVIAKIDFLKATGTL
ncbi:TolC family protein [Ferruginibacter yonginensis]|uniref:TolC family protein n=1 Tax=Ferruginibacter yonginensis TaxID=1310416 RepID=A0ABV8QSV1_9BACT